MKGKKKGAKRKFGTVLDEDVIRKVKSVAYELDLPISDVVAEAVRCYGIDRSQALEAFKRLDSNPLPLTWKELQDIEEIDFWEQ